MECPNRDRFCLVCGLFTPKDRQEKITDLVMATYKSYFNVKLVKKWYIPNIMCSTCRRGLDGGKSVTKFRYSSPCSWEPREEHNADDCYFCVSFANSHSYKYKTRERIPYFRDQSVIPPVLRSDLHKHSEKVDNGGQELDTSSDFENNSDFEEDDSSPRINQKLFFNLSRTLNLSQRKMEIAASFLKQNNAATSDLKICANRKRNNRTDFDDCFKTDPETGITYCPYIEHLFDQFEHKYKPENWRLFIDSSVNSLKAVLVHIGNEYPSVPIAYAKGIEESYDSMKDILNLIR